MLPLVYREFRILLEALSKRNRAEGNGVKKCSMVDISRGDQNNARKGIFRDISLSCNAH
jgi:hypothetical protein